MQKTLSVSVVKSVTKPQKSESPAICNVGETVYVFGGRQGSTAYNTLWYINRM